MAIASLEISAFRNLIDISLSCERSLNIIAGPNAAGKTAFLEAIYFLSRARSFRSNQIRELIAEGNDKLRVIATLNTAERRYLLGIERSPRAISARVEGRPIKSLIELTGHLPVLLLTPESHRLLEGGPSERRRFMDWGLFHGEPRFLSLWKRYRKALKHRNAALRGGSVERTIAVWEQELVAAGEVLDGLRRRYCATLESALSPLMQALLGLGSFRIDYRRGWSEERNLLDLLARDRGNERQYGHTRHGPHRADFVVRLGDHAATDRLSRGQQKLLVIGLTLAQAADYRAGHDEPCVLLIDDLPAELDRSHRDRVMHCLGGQDTQLFITAIEPAALDLGQWAGRSRVVRLNHGTLDEMV